MYFCICVAKRASISSMHARHHLMHRWYSATLRLLWLAWLLATCFQGWQTKIFEENNSKDYVYTRHHFRQSWRSLSTRKSDSTPFCTDKNIDKTNWNHVLPTRTENRMHLLVTQVTNRLNSSPTVHNKHYNSWIISLPSRRGNASTWDVTNQ